MSKMTPNKLIPATVITGFLGSGKTTLLNALLHHPELADTAVLVNEFGEVGIDHLLVEALEEEDVVLLNAGCLCCTIRNDLVGSLEELYEKRSRGDVPKFKRVVIETTGLADPVPILHTLLGHEGLREIYYVDGIVTTVDAVNGQRQLSEHVESVRQAAVADRLVITKTDLSEAATVDALRERLCSINPGGQVLNAVSGNISPAQLLDTSLYNIENKHPDVAAWLSEAGSNEHVARHGHDVSRHDDRIRSFSLQTDTPIKIHRFVAWVERLLETQGDKLLRLKGVLDIEGCDVPIVVHGVAHIFHPLSRLNKWPDSGRTSRLVLIGKELDTEAVGQAFSNEVLSQPR